MKNLLVLCLVFCGSAIFSQDISKMLQANKWYAKYDTNTMKMIYSKKAVNGSHETFEFKENGKIFWCGTVEESSVDAIGSEKQTTNYKCDSIRKYEVKNGILKIQILKQNTDYYKLAMKGQTVELSPASAEAFNK